MPPRPGIGKPSPNRPSTRTQSLGWQHCSSPAANVTRRKRCSRASRSTAARRSLKHRLFLDDFAQKHRDEPLEAEATASPADPRARYRWGVMLAAQERYEPAFEQLLESVRLDRTFADGAARKAILALFDILGLDSRVTREFQRQLSSVLF